jgi:hypothetical protein
MQTDRDAEIVAWIGRLGAAGAEHVMLRFEIGRRVAYSRLNSLTRDGLLEHHAVLHGRPGMYTATSSGLRWQGLGRLHVCTVRPGGFEHAWQVAGVAVELRRAMADWDLLSERDVRSIESDHDELLASAHVGSVGERPVLHRPDLALISPEGRVVPIEIELSAKSVSRLAAICRGWTRARHAHTVYYLATPGPGRAVQRAIDATGATHRIRVLAMNDIPLLVAEQSKDQPALTRAHHPTEAYR